MTGLRPAANLRVALEPSVEGLDLDAISFDRLCQLFTMMSAKVQLSLQESKDLAVELQFEADGVPVTVAVSELRQRNIPLPAEIQAAGEHRLAGAVSLSYAIWLF